jgi:hypothetical protein
MALKPHNQPHFSCVERPPCAARWEFFGRSAGLGCKVSRAAPAEDEEMTSRQIAFRRRR